MISNKKRILSVFASMIVASNLLAQVGVNTERPITDLDVNGNTHITGNLLTGGDDNTKGTAGTKDMLLISQGEGAAPQWKVVEGFDIIKDEKWYLVGIISDIDTSGGIVLSQPGNYQTGSIIYDTNYTVTQSSTDSLYNWRRNGDADAATPFYWREFEGMDFTIPASDKELRIFLNIQVPIQAYWDKTPPEPGSGHLISCTFGVFGQQPEVAGKKKLQLVASMQGGCIGSEENNTPTTTLTMISVIDIAPSTTESKFHILGTVRSFLNPNIYTGVLYMGTDSQGDSSPRAAFNRLTSKVDIFAKTKDE